MGNALRQLDDAGEIFIPKLEMKKCDASRQWTILLIPRILTLDCHAVAPMKRITSGWHIIVYCPFRKTGVPIQLAKQ